MNSINAPESPQKLPIPTHLVRILEAGTAVIECVPAGSTSATLILKRTTADGYECAIDHFEFDLTEVTTVQGGDHTDVGSGTTCGQYSLAPCARHLTSFTEYPECPNSEYITPSLFVCSESSYLKAYRDDKQKASASYSLSTVEGIQQVSRSRQYSR